MLYSHVTNCDHVVQQDWERKGSVNVGAYFFPEFIEGGTFWYKMFIFYAFTIKRPIFFFGKMPSESNHDNEPAFKELYSLQTKGTLLEKTIAYWLIQARCLCFSQTRWALFEILFSESSAVVCSTTTECHCGLRSLSKINNQENCLKWEKGMKMNDDILNSPGFLCFSFCFWH